MKPIKRLPRAEPSDPVAAIGYVRVSTGRQAEQGMSLPEQERRIEACAALHGYELTRTFCDRGLTGRIQTRPQFQAMMRYVQEPANGIKAVVIYHSSRLFRNTQLLLQYMSELEGLGIRLLSATQPLPDGHDGRMLMTMLAAIDTHASDQNALQVRDVMMANAEAGYWNGSKPPYGYKTRVAAVLRNKEKKVLAEDESEGPVVRLIHRWCLEGDGSGPMGIKKIVEHLNANGFSYRGKRFYTSAVEVILKNETYTGTFTYNRIDSRTRTIRPDNEHIKIKVPVIIPTETFLAVQRMLQTRRPNVTAPRLTNGPTLLAGIAVCEHCAWGMQLRTGKSGQYRYLTCSSKANKGSLECRGLSVRMDVVDEIVIGAVEDKVFAPERLRVLMRDVVEASNAGLAEMDSEIARQQACMNDERARLKRLYDSIEHGIVDMRDEDIGTRIADLKLAIAERRERIETLKARRVSYGAEISEERLEGFSREARLRLRNADPAFRKNWLHLFVDRVVIGPNAIRILGPKQALAEGLTQGTGAAGTMVPSFARKWRAGQNRSANVYVIDIAR